MKKRRLLGLLAGGVMMIGAAPLASAQETMEMLSIGAPGNAPESNGYGAVAYPYEISRKPVSFRQYVRFLNAVDLTGENRLRLYHPDMASHPEGGIRVDPDRPEGERYQLREANADRPVRFVNWLDAARYVNWYSNGGVPGSSTERGSYDLSGSPKRAVGRSADARYWIPDENEWYKAAFYRSATPEQEPRYQRGPLWPDAMRNRMVMEIVDRAPEQSDYRPAVSAPVRPVHFVFADAFSPLAEANNRGFRLAGTGLPPVGEDGKTIVDKEVAPPAVGEGPPGPLYQGGPAWVPGGGFPMDFGSVPFPYPVETVEETDLDPSS